MYYVLWGIKNQSYNDQIKQGGKNKKRTGELNSIQGEYERKKFKTRELTVHNPRGF